MEGQTRRHRLDNTTTDRTSTRERALSAPDPSEGQFFEVPAWLVHCNTERLHLGYHNMGRRPIETVMALVS